MILDPPHLLREDIMKDEGFFDHPVQIDDLYE